ncbi:MAG TPA: hypothetical protein ENH01_04345 [Nitrospirae bacterium]|nr:hypothetical protein [Nitrospirota bacterium]
MDLSGYLCHYSRYHQLAAGPCPAHNKALKGMRASGDFLVFNGLCLRTSFCMLMFYRHATLSFALATKINMNDMEDIVILEWKFSPIDYFEENICIKRDAYIITITSGTIEAQIRPEIYDNDKSILDRLHNALNDRFIGVQMLSHKPYELSKASMYRLHPDGRKDITIFAEPCVIKMTIGEVDFIVKDKDKNVISDSKKKRIQKKIESAELVEKYRQKDAFLASLLKSYSNAVNDPDNELVHLYEIRDAVAKRFKSESNAKHALGISGTRWSRFGKLTNDEPLKQGRHRGKNPGVLRDATEEELKEVRDIARNIIEAYLESLN